MSALFPSHDRDERTILADASSGTVTLTLPLASTKTGVRITVKKIDESDFPVTVLTSSDDRIDLASRADILVPMTSLQVLSDGEDWWIV